jgi:hypothetical protein
MDKRPVRRGGAHMRNCCYMWVMTWIHERAGNGTKNQVLYDTINKYVNSGLKIRKTVVD